MKKADVICLVLGISLGIVAGLGHMESVERNRLSGMVVKAEPINTEHTQENEEERIERIIGPDEENLPESGACKTVLDPDIPVEVQAAAEFCGNLYSISPELLEAIAFYESSYRSNAVNGSCKGLMQVKESCHKARMEKLGCTDIWNPTQNMLVASDYLFELFETYEDVGIVLMIYNGDSRAFSGHLSGYAIRILDMAEDLEKKHGKVVEQ